MTEFEFVDELPPKLVRNEWKDLINAAVLLEQYVVALKARPGMWAAYPIPDQQRSSTDINAGRPRAFRGRRFEAIKRNGVLYVRYIGSEETDGA